MVEVQLLTSVDGVITPSFEAMLPLPDDGFFRGDGAFEVVRSYAGHLFARTEHLDRLEASAASIDLQIQRQTLEAEIETLMEAVGRSGPDPDCLLRIVVTRAGRRVLSVEPLPVHAASVALATVTYAPSMILNGVKSLSYAANMQATRIASRAGADEALLLTQEGLILEPPTSTLFWVSSSGVLRTTETTAGVLDSITRRRVIENLEVECGQFPIEDATGASEAFLASTTREIQPVHSIDGISIPLAPAPRTRAAAMALRETVGRRL
jgi:branched-chain amino acid aminotransferase